MKMETIRANSVISDAEDLMPPVDVAMPTTELSTTTAITIKAITTKTPLPPILDINSIKDPLPKGIECGKH